ncbi:hypothetical protein L228DRAFT_89454 [Xylona heveae TC161]|uniref:Uncharacterized protein n=1 Tax=Xylona heveae (strain CBS 132557 / TC161) TaxID=1328760 RepID=A0A165HYQ1_XYLHT|nr:hypothetical protein L228DRAFT_89454 [Xylona heveae TC161]KZF24108.1 hypothetical protein L228DRAFT_89454 [Xylona heveae TC161]
MATPVVRTALIRIRCIVDQLLPFTFPDTPVAQDILHTVILCSLLYFAPSLFERWRGWASRRGQNFSGEHRGNGGTGYSWIIHHMGSRTANADVNFGDVVEAEGEFRPTPEASDEDYNVLDEVEPEETGGIANQIQLEGDNAAAPMANGAGRFEPEAFDTDADTGARLPTQHQPHVAAGDSASQSRSREVGKKKAASLARRDQRRAYYEFLRSQGDAQRARDRAAEAVLSTEQIEVKQRRLRQEQQLRERRQAEWTSKRERERQIREEQLLQRQNIVSKVRKDLQNQGWSDIRAISENLNHTSRPKLELDALGLRLDSLVKSPSRVNENDSRQSGHVTPEWVVRLVRADGLVINEVSGGSINLLTHAGFLVHIDEKDMRVVYQMALEFRAKDVGESVGKANGITSSYSVDDRVGPIGWIDIGRFLEKTLRENFRQNGGKCQ